RKIHVARVLSPQPAEHLHRPPDRADARRSLRPRTPMPGWLNGKLFGAGARTASLYHRVLGVVLLGAWISLGVQVRVLMGARGLLPAQGFLGELNAGGIGFWAAPSWLRFGASDGTLLFGVIIGAAMAVLCAVGRPRPAVRPLFAAQALLYLGYCVAGRTFFL